MFAACGKTDVAENGDSSVTYTVTVTVNEAEYGTVSVSKVENVANGTPITINGNELTIDEVKVVATAATETEQYSYEFVDWSAAEKVTGDVVITANFTRTQKVFEVTFISDGEVYSNIVTVKSGGKVAVPAVNPEKPSDSYHEYSFDGWYCGDKKWDFENDAVLSDLTLEAKWKIESSYTEEFLPGGIC